MGARQLLRGIRMQPSGGGVGAFLSSQIWCEVLLLTCSLVLAQGLPKPRGQSGCKTGEASQKEERRADTRDGDASRLVPEAGPRSDGSCTHLIGLPEPDIEGGLPQGVYGLGGQQVLEGRGAV